jgi:DNA-binding CsgD family transcriptional regulator
MPEETMEPEPGLAMGPAPADVLTRITVARARILRELERHDSEAEAAAALGLSMNGLRSHIRDLKGITGATSVREMQRWWRENRGAWLRELAAAAGVSEAELAS